MPSKVKRHGKLGVISFFLGVIFLVYVNTLAKDVGSGRVVLEYGWPAPLFRYYGSTAIKEWHFGYLVVNVFVGISLAILFCAVVLDWRKYTIRKWFIFVFLLSLFAIVNAVPFRGVHNLGRTDYGWPLVHTFSMNMSKSWPNPELIWNVDVERLLITIAACLTISLATASILDWCLQKCLARNLQKP